MFRSLAVCFLQLCFFVEAQNAGLETKRGVTAEDYYAFKTLGDPHLSPDGTRVAYTVSTVDQKANRRDTSIWLVPTDGKSEPRRLSSEGSNASRPRWSSDGKTLAFVSKRAPETQAQLFLLSMDGGEAVALTKLKNGVSAFEWAPDGTRLVCVSRSGPSDKITGEPKSDVRHYRHIDYKFNDTGWFDDKRGHLWVVTVKGGEAKQITEGDDWNDSDPQWSPDGTRIAFVSNRTGKEYDGDHNSDVWVVSAAGGALTKISDHPFEDDEPRWSPDGSKILFAGQMQRRELPKLYVAPSSGGPAKLAVNDLDLIPGELKWQSTETAYFTSGNHARTSVFRVDLAEHKVTPFIAGERAVHAFDANSKAGVVVYLANDFAHMDDLYAADADGGSERRLTGANAALWNQLEPQPVIRMDYKSTDGTPIEGFLVKPRGWVEGKKYPMILSVHGGPAGQYGVDWYHEFQVYASRGWAVFFTNPRGSTGYGQKFERGIVNNWGGMDYQDIMAGVDEVLKQNAWIDVSRLGVTGGSYGGFMTNWIVGHTNRFKCAVTLRSISNFVSDEGTRDGAYGHEDDFKGFVFDDFEQFWDASPLKYARNVKTPTLVLHSDNDFRVPLEQGEQWFRALQHYGVPSELVIFPRENHNLTRTGEPKHLVESLNWQVYWFTKYLDGDAGAKAPDAN